MGAIKQLAAAHDPLVSITINSLPPPPGEICATTAGLIQISTDCVFSGRKGMYTESEVPDAEDLYGRTKILGEVSASRCLTLRASLIGRELSARNGLVGWFFSRRGTTVNGYARAIFSGLSTALLPASFWISSRHSDLSGIYRLAADPIDKYDLLPMLDDSYDAHVQIGRDQSVVIDRSRQPLLPRCDGVFDVAVA